MYNIMELKSLLQEGYYLTTMNSRYAIYTPEDEFYIFIGDKMAKELIDEGYTHGQ